MLGKQDILRGLRALDAKAREAGMVIELAIYGGAALALAFDLRQATRDVDVVVRGSSEFLRNAAREVARDEGWPEDWMNDGVKGFVAANETMRLMAAFDGAPGGGLRILMPTPEYLFAMKCLAKRLDSAHDVADIEALADIAGIRSAAEALDLVEAFYPRGRISAKTKFGVEEIMARVEAKRSAKAAVTKRKRQPSRARKPSPRK